MTRHISALGTIVCVLIAGCTSSRHGGTQSGAQPQATTARSASPSASARQVPVELDDYIIRMPASLSSGDVTFVVKNVGKHAHNIRLRGPGGDAALSHNLRGGESATLDMHLAPGEYRVTCPVGPHAMMGMRTTLTVNQ